MKTRSNQLKKTLFFLFLCIVMCCAETGHAVESKYGKVTANVNLRKYNGLHGKIITEIKKGEKVLIKDKIGDWYQVIVERNTYGYIGWIYGKYVRKANGKKEKSTPLLQTHITKATFKETHAKDLLKIDLLEIKEAQKAALLLKTQKNPYLIESVPAIKKVEKPQPIEIEKPEITPEYFLSSKEEKKQNILDDSKKYAYPLGSVPVIEENENRQPAISKNKDDLIDHFGIADFMKLLLRLSTIVLSCLALLLSYKAFQLTIKVPTMKGIASSLIAFLHSITRIRIPLMNNTTSSRVS